MSFETAEMALAQGVESIVTQAYMPDDLLEARRSLIANWADYIG